MVSYSSLVVDDDCLVLSVIVRMLKKLGYQVIPCSCVDYAFQVCELRVDTIHMLLSDINMPKTNGFELASRLVVYYPAMQVLFMSGARNNTDGQKEILDAIESRNWNVLNKPFTIEDLKSSVEQILRKAEPPPNNQAAQEIEKRISTLKSKSGSNANLHIANHHLLY